MPQDDSLTWSAMAAGACLLAAWLCLFGSWLGQRLAREVRDLFRYGLEWRWWWRTRALWQVAFVRRYSGAHTHRVHHWTLYLGPLELRRWA